MKNKFRTLEEDIEFSYNLVTIIGFDNYIKEGLISEDEIDSLNALDFIEYLLNESNEINLLPNDIVKKIYLVTSYYLYDYPKVTTDIINRCHNIITLTNRIVAGERDLEKIKEEILYRTKLNNLYYELDDVSFSYNTDIILYDCLNKSRNYELSNLINYKELIQNRHTIASIINVMNKHLYELTAIEVEQLRDIVGYKIVLFNDCQNQLQLYKKMITTDGKVVEEIDFDDSELAYIVESNNISFLEELYHVLNDTYMNIYNVEQSLDPEKLMRKNH